MKDIIKNIKEQILDSKRFNEDLDATSFAYETGVLLSVNDAQKVLDALTASEPTVQAGANCSRFHEVEAFSGNKICPQCGLKLSAA